MWFDEIAVGFALTALQGPLRRQRKLLPLIKLMICPRGVVGRGRHSLRFFFLFFLIVRLRLAAHKCPWFQRIFITIIYKFYYNFFIIYRFYCTTQLIFIFIYNNFSKKFSIK